MKKLNECFNQFFKRIFEFFFPSQQHKGERERAEDSNTVYVCTFIEI